MKILELQLKKDVLIVQPDERGNINSWIALHSKKWNFICLGSELTEEIASELVNETLMYEKHKVKCYRYRSYKEGFVGFDNAIESFISAIESIGFYWLKNPIPPYIPITDKKADENYMEKYFEAEEKTFKNPLIFTKR